MGKRIFLSRVAFFTCFFAFFVIALGAFTRLVDAGLGCPDWPGCYGHLFVPSENQVPLIITYKAWAEMAHRYAVGCLSIFSLVIIAYISVMKSVRQRGNIVACCLLVLLFCYQILLGRWTVTLKLLPIIVTQHLLGGFLILATLWFIFLNNQTQKIYQKSRLLPWAVFGLFLLLIQIFLGAWTSTNYASLSCTDFPFCNNMADSFTYQIKDAFQLFSPIGINYDGGVLPASVRQTIQMVHRIGAAIVTAYLFCFSAISLQLIRQQRALHRMVFVIIGLLCVQLCLGISNVIFKLPVITAIGHTLVAALLLLSMITFLFKLSYRQNEVEYNHDIA